MKDKYKYIDRKLIIRRMFLILLDILLSNFASLCAIVTRFDFRIAGVPLEYSEAVLRYAPVYTIITITIFFIFRLYHSLWRYASIEEMTNVIYACTVTAMINYIGMKLLHIHVPRSFYPLNLLYLICFEVTNLQTATYLALQQFGITFTPDLVLRTSQLPLNDNVNIIRIPRDVMIFDFGINVPQRLVNSPLTASLVAAIKATIQP